MVWWAYPSKGVWSSTQFHKEPEAHAFPFHTKFLAERLAMDDSNSYIITTHNPYFLETILDKVPDEDLSVYVARNDGGVSEFRSLEASKIREIIAEGPTSSWRSGLWNDLGGVPSG